MSADLELSVLSPAKDGLGFVSGLAVTDQMIVALGGEGQAPLAVASANARDFTARNSPKGLGLRDVLPVADSIWACGEHGQLAVSRDHGATWRMVPTGTEDCLFGLALGPDGALWVVGDRGYAARVLGPAVQRVELGTTDVRMSAVYAVRDEIVALGADGQLRRWRGGKVVTVPCGATKGITSLAVTAKGSWIVVGEGGFVARSPDGQWFSRANSEIEADLEAVCALPDGSLVAVGDRGVIVRSIDDGRTWRELPNELGERHLWAIERFGEGVLIGGEGGLVVKLAPPGDATWSERVDVVDVVSGGVGGGGEAVSLDEVLGRGPEGFVSEGLVAYLEAIGKTEAAEDEDEEDEEDDEGDEDAEDDDDAWNKALAALGLAKDDEDDGAGEDDAEGENENDDDDDAAPNVDAEAARLLGASGDAGSFRTIHGMPLPPEAAAFFDAVAPHRRSDCFEELRLDAELLPDVGEHNLFELIVRRDQTSVMSTDLVDAFCGVFHIGSLDNGDSYHLELYEWEGQRRVMHFDHETQSLSKTIADSLDSLVYLAALSKAGDERKIARSTYREGLRALYGKVSPTWHFGIEDKDKHFVQFEPERRDSEFFFFRSRWITALLKHDTGADASELRDLFMADFNGLVQPEALPGRLEACQKFIPTALYAMWRAYFWGEPELEPYLQVGRTHAARLVRDAAKLIDELLAGRNELGTIRDMRAYVRELRALDLDPRRAGQRQLEAAARAQADAAHIEEVVAELDEAPPERWPELAWQWLGDGIAHRRLLEQLDRAQPEELDALVALHGFHDDERTVALPRLAAELSPELEALLVGSLARGDKLEGVLVGPREDEDEDGEPAEPWSEERSFAGDMRIETEDGLLTIELGAVYAADLVRALRGRVHDGRGYELSGRDASLKLEPSEGAGYRHDEHAVVLEVTPELAGAIEAGLAPGLVGTYRIGPWLQIVVTPSIIRGLGGLAVDVRGVADPEEAQRLIEEENARLEEEGEDEGDDDDDDDDEEEYDDDDEDDDEEDDDDERPPSVAKITAALGMTGRALRLAPHDTDVQFTHAMLLLDADRAEMPGRIDELLEWLPRFAPAVRLQIVVRMGEHHHVRFADAVDLALAEPPPETILATSATPAGGGVMMSFGNVASELFGELGEAILALAPSKMARLVPLLPADVSLLAALAWKSIQAGQRDCAVALYERVLALPIPTDGEDRQNYLRAMNNACIQAHAAKAYEAAIRIADRAQPVAHENPYIFHSAACAYAAVGDYARAFDQVKLAVQHEYEHLSKVEVDSDLGPLLEWPEFKELFRDWRVRQEGN